MTEDPRCCGTGTCIINADGHCWCGQQWDGSKMCHPPLQPFTPAPAATAAATVAPAADLQAGQARPAAG